MNTRQGLNRIGLSMEDMKSLSQDYIGKNISVSIKLNQIWKCLEQRRWGFLWRFKKWNEEYKCLR